MDLNTHTDIVSEFEGRKETRGHKYQLTINFYLQ